MRTYSWKLFKLVVQSANHVYIDQLTVPRVQISKLDLDKIDHQIYSNVLVLMDTTMIKLTLYAKNVTLFA